MEIERIKSNEELSIRENGLVMVKFFDEEEEYEIYSWQQDESLFFNTKELKTLIEMAQKLLKEPLDKQVQKWYNK